MATVVVREFDNAIEGHIARAVLEAEGIPAQLLGDHVYTGVPGLSSIRLIVREEDADRARELLHDDPSDEGIQP